MSLLAEISIYLYVGMDSLYRGNWTNVSVWRVVVLVVVLLISIVVSRVIFVLPICYLQNLWNKRHKLQLSEMLIIIWVSKKNRA